MTLCPIALAVGCRRCPAFSVCPLKTTLGDQPRDPPPPPPPEAPKKKAPAKRR